MKEALLNSRLCKTYKEDYKGELNQENWFRNYDKLSSIERIAEAIMEITGVGEFQRTDDCIQINYMKDEWVTLKILVTSDQVYFRTKTTEWLGPHLPSASSIKISSCAINPYSSNVTDKLKENIEKALKIIEGEIRICPCCGEKIPSGFGTSGKEFGFEGAICDTCAGGFGVIF